MSEENRLARFKGATVEHLLRPGTKTTACGRDATLANRYPFLTRANSNDRLILKRCRECTARGV